MQNLIYMKRGIDQFYDDGVFWKYFQKFPQFLSEILKINILKITRLKNERLYFP